MIRFHPHYGGHAPQLESILAVARQDVWFAFALTKAFDREWSFVLQVRSELFCESFERLTGCIDSGLI